MYSIIKYSVVRKDKVAISKMLSEKINNKR